MRGMGWGLLALVGVGCDGEMSEFQAILDLEGDVARGASIYAQRCSGCHGSEGQGGTTVSLAGKVFDDDTLLTIVLDGQGSMPAFRTQLDDQSVADLRAHLRDAILGE